MKSILSLIVLTIAPLSSVSNAEQPAAKDGEFPVESNLRAGVCKTDITPAETDGVVVTGHRRTVHGVRDPLRAGVLLLDDGDVKAAIVTLDVIADRAVPIIVGCANGNLGYIATADAYEVGGYEPNTSKLAPEAEPIILAELGRLADRVVGDVFESFSKHPKDLQRREQVEKARLQDAKQKE